MLTSPDDWIWDSWIADDGERYHLFFLKAPRALGDPDLRHERARIGHASSLDLRDWEVHEDALGPNDTGFDDLALWTGSVARGEDGVWRMYYTALNTEGRGVKDQRIGLAESADLMTWRAVAEPLVEPDPCHYRMVADGSSETWRDPFVFQVDGDWHMLITARDPTAERLFDGVLPTPAAPTGELGAGAAADRAVALRAARGVAGALRGRAVAAAVHLSSGRAGRAHAVLHLVRAR